MSDRYRWLLILTSCCAALALLMQAPSMLHTRDSRFRGVPVVLNSDEEIYQARVEEALQGRPEQAAEAIVGDPSLKGSQLAVIEAAEGRMFAFTGWDAPALFQMMDTFIPCLLFLALWFFFRRAGFAKGMALAGAGAFSLLELYNLNRPVYQRTSTLLVIVSFLLLLRGVEGRRMWDRIAGLAGGLLLGALTGGYFWAWTFGWLWLAILIGWEGSIWFQDKTRTGWLQSRWAWLLLFAAVGGLAAVPGITTLLGLSHDPAYADALFRSGIHPSHLPESWIYSLLFLVMATGLVWIAVRLPAAARKHGIVIVTGVSAFIAINQQVVHGTVFNFVSHYLFFLVIAALLAVMLIASLRVRPRLLWIPALAAIVYLAAIGYDGRHVISQWKTEDADFGEQHFADLLQLLTALPRSRILSDPDTSLFVAGSTKHDVVYALYLKNVLLSHQALAERFCATQIPVPPEQQDFASRTLLWPDADSAFQDDPTVRQREVALVTETCARMEKDPSSVLTQFKVDYILWDQKRQPEWHMGRFGVPLTKFASGSGWTMWKANN